MKKPALSFLFAASIALLSTCAMAGTEIADARRVFAASTRFLMERP